MNGALISRPHCCVFQPANRCSACRLLVEINFLMLLKLFAYFKVIKCIKVVSIGLYFDQQTACGAPIPWSKYTTPHCKHHNSFEKLVSKTGLFLSSVWLRNEWWCLRRDKKIQRKFNNFCESKFFQIFLQHKPNEINWKIFFEQKKSNDFFFSWRGHRGLFLIKLCNWEPMITKIVVCRSEI